MRTREADGLIWSAREGSDDHLAWGGHETGVVALALALLPPGGVFVDVGAHVGAFSLRLAGKANHVVALEAASDTFAGLTTNVALNCLEEKVTCLPFAAWDSETILYASLIAVMDEEGGTRERHPGDGSTHLVTRQTDVDTSVDPVHAYTLDQLLANFGWRVDLIKIDVEGAEGRVLAGAENTVHESRPIMIIEMHDRLLPEHDGALLVAQVDDFLARHQYVKSNPLEAGAGYHLICTPREKAHDGAN